MAKKLGFGCMRLPLLNPADQASFDKEQLKRMVDTFIERGFTYFDTAWMYHNFQSEEVLKEVLVERYPRESYTITSKLPIMMIYTEEKQSETFQRQLQKVGVDYFDYYLVHSLNENTYKNAVKLKSFEYLQQLKAEGKIKHMGISFHDNAELLDRILTEHPEIELVQIQLNYVDWDSDSIQSGKCYEVICKHNKPVVVMEPIKGGTLINVPDEVKKMFKQSEPNLSVASWAIRFAASQPQVMMVLSGMSSYEQLDDNTSYMQDFKPLTEEQIALTHKAAEIINSSIAVPCTSCRYCVKGCPKKIAIPEYFSLYNQKKRFGKKGFVTEVAYYNNLIVDHGKASECIECKKCEKICPQHIKISEVMKEVAKELEL
jgi:predicted aldo/keto reductase-like oxidoreductase